jgi:hypothetical protein
MKKSTRKGLIYSRYILPVVAVIIMLILMSVPAYRFITAQTGINQPVSLFDLLGNSWSTVRHHLFSGDAERSEATVYFSKYVMTMIIALTSLFVLGVISVIYTSVTAFMYIASKGRQTRARALFITLVPNRVLLCIYHALLLPIFLFPMMMPSVFGGILNQQIAIQYTPFNLLYAALVLYAFTVFAIFFTARYERIDGMDVFFKRKSFTKDIDEDEPEQESLDEALDAYERMDRLAKEEQAQRILRLLNKDKDENCEEDK